jgi:hypothetical protein
MKKSVKTLVLITIGFLFTTNSTAQLKLPGNNAVANDVKKVIEDYPNRFINIMGEVLTQNTQSTDYHCNFSVQGAEETFITRYPSKKEICSWQALMLTTETFEKAKQKFKSLFNQLNNLSVKSGTGTFKLKAEYESPEEVKKFTSIIFTFEPGNESVKKLKVEISMQYIEPMEWKVKLLIYDREREDDERGNVRE